MPIAVMGWLLFSGVETFSILKEDIATIKMKLIRSLMSFAFKLQCVQSHLMRTAVILVAEVPNTGIVELQLVSVSST